MKSACNWTKQDDFCGPSSTRCRVAWRTHGSPLEPASRSKCFWSRSSIANPLLQINASMSGTVPQQWCRRASGIARNRNRDTDERCTILSLLAAASTCKVTLCSTREVDAANLTSASTNRLARQSSADAVVPSDFKALLMDPTPPHAGIDHGPNTS